MGIMTASKRLNRIEKIKKELHPFEDEFKKRMEKYFEEGDYRKIPPDDIERLKYYGIFYRKVTPGYFMVRIRVPGGVLNYQQARKLAELSQKYADNLIEITSRQQIQMRWIELKNLKVILQELSSVGLTTLQTGLDNVRNVVQDPLAGLAVESEIDTTPLVLKMTDAILGKKEYADLPRKLNPVILGSTRDPINALYNDVTFYLSRKGEEIGFNLYAGGKIGSGGPEKGFDINTFVKPEEVVEVFTAVVRLYSALGYRDNRNRNRIWFLVNDLTPEGFKRELEKFLGRNLPSKGEVLVKTYGDRTGIIPQRGEDELYSVPLGVPSGKITGGDFEEIAKLARKYGNGELRLTVYQNIYLVNVKGRWLRQLLMEPIYERYEKNNNNWIINTVACAGSDTCQFGVIENKSDAIRVGNYLREKVYVDVPIRLHWSACVKGCGQHGAADVGFVGTKMKVAGKAVEAVEVFVGGSHALPAKKIGVVPLKGLEYRLEKLFRFYMNHRHRGETFFHFVHRVGVKKIKKFFKVEEPSKPKV